MKRIVVLLAIIFYVAVVGGRNLYDDNLETEDSEDGYPDKHVRDPTNNQRHRLRRRPRQSLYNHFNSYNPYDDYNGWRRDDRRDFYNRQQEQLLSRILNDLEELSNYVKKTQTPPPPPPPQIIYVPFPYPVQQCQNQTNPFIPNFIHRLREIKNQTMTGKNQNCDCDVGSDDDDGSDGSRPINFDPIESKEPTVKPPPVEHGSSQAGMTTAKPAAGQGRCKAAILVCCHYKSDQEKGQCFSNYGCTKTYSLGQACHPFIVKRVIEEFAETYGPINNT